MLQGIFDKKNKEWVPKFLKETQKSTILRITLLF